MTTTPEPVELPLRNGVCVVDGYGIRITVERGHLHISDGTGRTRRQRRITRSDRNLQRLIVIGHTGYITLDALRWLDDTGAALVHLDEGRLITTSTPAGTPDGRLRRAQAAAKDTDTGLAISRTLITQKLRGQAGIARRLLDGHLPAPIADAFDIVNTSDNPTQIRWAEANAAKAYWRTLAELPVTFAPKAVVPDHWRRVGPRTSRLATSPRNATTPAHAIWNYLYTLLEAETTIACHTLALDPLLGFIHVDRRHRNALPLDLVEPIRPLVDTYVLDLLANRTFADRDFHETRQGVVRLLEPLTHQFAQAATAWAADIHDVTSAVARILADSADGHVRLSQAAKPRARTARTRPANSSFCRDCGQLINTAERVLCNDCLQTHQRLEADRIPQLGRQTLADWRNQASDEDVAAVYDKASATNTRQWAARKAFNSDQANTPTNPDWYDTNIRPHLKQISRAELTTATGLNPSYVSQIRNGKKGPHPIHWPAILDALATPTS